MVAVVPEDNKDNFEAFVGEFEAIAQDEFKDADPGLVVEIESVDVPKTVFDEKAQKSMYDAVAACPNGVIKMSENVKGIVETSTNLAIVKSDGKKIEFCSWFLAICCSSMLFNLPSPKITSFDLGNF